jgi:uncharacterized protein YbaP (TraB family)
MSNSPVGRLPVWLALLFCCAGASAADGPQRHSLWSVAGKSNTVYLLGSVHFLNQSEQLPAVVDEAYGEAETLIMEIDMDDLDREELQRVTFDLGMLPPDQSLETHLGAKTYAQVAEKAQSLGIDPAALQRLRPWLAALTLVQFHLMKMGLDPSAGVEHRLTERATRDSKPIQGLETLREQLGIMASLPDDQQREFLMYSVEDTERATREIETLLAAWRKGDSRALADLLAQGFAEYPGLYRPLTVDRNRKWLTQIEPLLDDEDDYLIVVGTLHLVGKDSVLELLESKGHKVRQH